MSNVSIGGRGGNPIPSTTLVAVDNVTIFGDGSGQNPLTTEGAGGQFLPFLSLQDLAPGGPVAVSPTVPTDVVLAQSGRNNASVPLGLVSLDSNGDKQIQTSGTVTLPTATWDTAIQDGTSGGLTPRQSYYVGSEPGQISANPIGARVGYALSATQMALLLATGSPNTIVLPNEASEVVLGMAVLLDEPSSTLELAPAVATSLAAAEVVGVAAFIDGSGNVVAAGNGETVTLTTAQWDVIVGGSTGLAPDATYYLSAATAGHMVGTTPPAAAGDIAVKVGVALSTTQLYVQISINGYAHP